MTELEIDRSHLPRVQKVCQCFAVLEDAVLAHSLQEQEIEQHYSANVRTSRLAQRDLRTAKQLQDEEQRGVILHQATQQLQERDFEYGCMIQEEILHNADEEVAKRIQEGEEFGARHGKLESCYGNLTGFGVREGEGLEQGSLQQVLMDRELARRLQEEEETIYRNLPRRSCSPPHSLSPDPEGDFRAAQVAQDEEIARYMQRQEMKSKWQSCDLEGQRSQQKHKTAGDQSKSAAARERKAEVQLFSPNEERTQMPHPVSSALRRQPIRNIAEELDPTFKGWQGNMDQSWLTDSGPLQASRSFPCGFRDYTEEAMFIPPTKRQSDKSARGKAKEKKERCKQQ
ncbi:hypothetical protein GJAV_G00189980 [Gymnothorax javanicus]|nr:hypothetical protein GJAV_G00189980 [Gymnothorax javanicus]